MADPSNVDVLAAWQRDTLARCDGVRFGTVVTYSDDPPRAAVQLAQRGGDAAGARSDGPPLPAVPVLWPAWGPIRVRGRLLPGDEVLVLIADRAIDRMLVQGGVVDLESDRMHHRHDAIAIPYAWSDPAQLARAGSFATWQLGRPDGTQLLELAVDGSSIRIDAATVIRLGTLAGAVHGVALGDVLDAILTALATALQGALDPAVAAAGTALQTALGVTPIASTKVMVE